MKKKRSGDSGSSASKRISNGLVALSSAAVLTVYSAGYARTRDAAARFDRPAAGRRNIPRPASRSAAATAELGAPSLTATRRSTSIEPVAPAPPATAMARAGRSEPAEAPTSAAGTAARVAPEPPAPLSASTPAVSLTPPAIPAESSVAPVAAPMAPSAPPLASSSIAARVPQPSSSSAASITPAPAAPPAAVHAAPAAVSAPPRPAATSVPAAANAPTYDPSEEPFEFRGSFKKDGTFLGWGSSRHGDIQASVEIRNGRVVSAQIAQCLTRYSCDVIDKLPPEVVARQSADVDYVSGATESADAFYDAIVDALAKAK